MGKVPYAYHSTEREENEITEDEAKAAITAEIKATAAFEMLFRENNPRVKLISEYVLEHSTSFLRKALRSTIQHIREASYLQEDPTKQLKIVSDLHYGLLDDLSEGKVGAVFPSDVARCLQHLSLSIDDTFPGVPNSGQIAVGSIFFLRTLCPTLLLPDRLGMRPYETESERAIAKAIVKRLQLLVNIVVRGEETSSAGVLAAPHREYLNGEEGRLKGIMKILVRPLYSQSPYFREEPATSKTSPTMTTAVKRRAQSLSNGLLMSDKGDVKVDEPSKKNALIPRQRLKGFNILWSFFKEGKHLEAVLVPGRRHL